MSSDKLVSRDEIQSLEVEISNLHTALEGKGINTRNRADIFGRRFSVPVDEEHKAIVDPCCGDGCVVASCANPHMRTFHTSWFGFFSSFFSTFAAAPLIAYIKDDLNLSKKEIGDANVASVTGTIVFRVMMGWICDKMGARRGLGCLLLLATPAIIGIMFVQDAPGFIICRLLIGCSLATFVACQVWCSQQFAKSVIGITNATAAGWGNLGGGVTNLVMPFIFLSFLSATGSESRAWRLCYLVPLGLHVLGGCSVLTGRDLPDGNFKELELSGAKQKTDSGIVIKTGVSNINAWILTITYGFCFGVELTMNNVGALYFYSYQGQTPQIAGIAASLFGMMNLFARSLGGMLSDASNKRFGMRGRLWSMYLVQVAEGAMCIVLGSLTLKYDAPYEMGDTPAYIYIEDKDWYDAYPSGEEPPTGWIPVAKCIDETDSDVPKVVSICGTLQKKASDALKECLGAPSELILLQDPPPDEGGSGYDCISHSDTFGSSIVVIIFSSVLVQMAEGLHFGVVPYVSRPALGIVSGMVGAGGNLGSVIATSVFFRGAFRTDQGIFNLGIMIIAVTSLMFGIYFPEHGGMFCKAGALDKLTWYPQVWKPPADYRGADSMDFSNIDTAKARKTETPKQVETSQA